MRRFSVLGAALALAALACTRTGPSLATTVVAGVVADVDAGADAGAGAGSAPAIAELPPWLRSLLDPEPRRTYAWRYAVETHDEQGSVAEAEGTLHCRSDGPTEHPYGEGKLAWVSCQACRFDPGPNSDAFDTDFDDCYLATSEGLWLVDAPPRDADHTRRIVAAPPYLPAHPEARAESRPAHQDGFDYEESLEVFDQTMQVMDRHALAWCRKDASTLMYGALTQRCFAPGFGLVVLEMEGRSGPSVETYPLVEIDPLPAAGSR